MHQDHYENAHLELTTILDYLRWAMSLFCEAKLHYGHGTDNAWDEAVALVLPVLHLPPDSDQRILGAHLTTIERQRVVQSVRRRIEERMPVPYLTHQAWFAGLEFFVDERVLVPRSPIAELIQNEFQPWIAADKVTRILDLCTGSGCIAVACAVAFPEAQVDATDISTDALEVAQANVRRHHVEDQVQVLASDLFAGLQGRKYDVIVSNPPYVGLDEWRSLPREYFHEPQAALVAQEDGLALVMKILREAQQHLTEQGILVVEVGNSADLLQQRLPQVPFVWLEFEAGEAEVFLLTAEQLRGIQ